MITLDKVTTEILPVHGDKLLCRICDSVIVDATLHNGKFFLIDGYIWNTYLGKIEDKHRYSVLAICNDCLKEAEK